MVALVDTGNSAMYLPEQIFDNFKVGRGGREGGREGGWLKRRLQAKAR